MAFLILAQRHSVYVGRLSGVLHWAAGPLTVSWPGPLEKSGISDEGSENDMKVHSSLSADKHLP